jgi:hypothetical protein
MGRVKVKEKALKEIQIMVKQKRTINKKDVKHPAIIRIEEFSSILHHALTDSSMSSDHNLENNALSSFV